MNRLVTVGTLIFCLTAVSGCMWSTHRVSETRTLSTEHMAGSPINVVSRNGAVSVTADPGAEEVAIEAKVTCGGQTLSEAQARLQQTTVTVDRDTSRSLNIAVQFPGGKQNGDGASFKIRLPEARGATIATSNGAIRVAGLSGELSLQTSNGSITISDHDGPVDVRTSNGAVKATGINGKAVVQTSNGSVTVMLAPEAVGPVRLKSSNGRITATVGPAFTGAVSLNTSNGRVTVTDPGKLAESTSISKASGTVRFAGDGGESWLRTSNGGVDLIVRKHE